MKNQSCFEWIIRKNFLDADFWLTNRGSAASIGQPKREFQPYYTGVKCPLLILPDYGYYLCIYLHQIGVWKQYASGTISFYNLKTSSIRQVFRELSRYHKTQHKQIKI